MAGLVLEKAMRCPDMRSRTSRGRRDKQKIWVVSCGTMLIGIIRGTTLTKEGNHRKAPVLELCLLKLEGPLGVL